MASTADPPPDPVASERPAPERSLNRLVGRGAAWSVSANVTMRLANIAVTAILARILAPDDFGVFAVALAVYLVVASLSELGMASAIARSANEPDDIAPTVATISILVSGGIGTALFVFAPALAAALGQPAAAEPIRVLTLSLLLTGIFAVPGAQLVREFKQDRIFLATIAGFLVSNPILVVLALHGGGATAFSWSRVVGQAVTGLVFYFSTSRRYRPGWRAASVGTLLRFGIPLSAANLVNWTLLNADYLILGRFVDAAEVGVYMIAFNVASWSTAVLGSVLNSVVVPAFGRVSGDRNRLAGALASASGLVGLIALPVGALTLALSGPLVSTLFGHRWDAAGPVLSVLAVYGLLYTFSLLYANVLVATGATVRLLLIQLLWVAVLVPAMIGALAWWGLVGAAWAHVVTIGLIAIPAYLTAGRAATGMTIHALLQRIARPAVAAITAGAVAWLTAEVLQPPWLRLIGGGLTGMLVYLAIMAPAIVRLLPERRVPRWLPARLRPGARAVDR